ncbi:hypothetical protein NDU88_004203 [Pleurodeles waltl]|uniref:Uncharacterized protein n=1 Tax=Pleurodeles waltl TaxID=8319 RepID=A0AAV7RFF9_PLEWA|nr:hypothetical protein NDU88_004203 [Pleurodeles waltl]
MGTASASRLCFPVARETPEVFRAADWVKEEVRVQGEREEKKRRRRVSGQQRRAPPTPKRKLKATEGRRRAQTAEPRNHGAQKPATTQEGRGSQRYGPCWGK